MATSDRKLAVTLESEEDFPLYFSEWIKGRRQELDLTQEQLAKRACCSVHTIRKIEMGERRPSRQLAELLAQALEIPAEGQGSFILVSRGERSVDCLSSVFSGRATQPAVDLRPSSANLPRALTPFIGREPEISALGQLLHDPLCSLLTIAGPGGIGKTRLAIEAAQQSKELFPDGMWFVSLVSLNSPFQIVPAIAGALDVKFQDPANLQAQLIRYLRTKKALVILDNAEHLLEGVGIFMEILEGCPQVRLLVTSRERLNLLSEWVFEIQGLPVPANDQVEQFEAYSSIALFLQSARRVRTGFQMREAERKWVLRICQIMEGMPLGIELSAAWVGLLSCEEIAKEIKHNLDFLSVSMRDLPERHRSLRAILDHSWKLLPEEERLVLSRLSVFRGSFNLKAAQEICGASLVLLSSLRNKYLLYRTEQELYHLHEIIRQYGGLKLAEDPAENERVKDRHAVYYVQCLSNWEKALQSSRQLETFNEMEGVIDNLAQAWRHMVTNCRPKSGEKDLLCTGLLHSALFSLSLFYEQRCRSLEAIPIFEESVEYLQTLQPGYEGTEDFLHITSILGHVTAYLGLHHYYIIQYDESREYLEEAVLLLGKSQSEVEKAQAKVMLASLYAESGQLQNALALLEQSREVFREQDVKWWYALSTTHLANIFTNLGKLQESEALFQEALQLVEPGDLRSGLPLRSGYAFILYLKNDFGRAEQLLQDGLQQSYLFGNFRLTSLYLYYLGRVALSTGRIDLAEEYIQKSINLKIEFGESHELGVHRLFLGRCFLARSDLKAAQDQFRQVIKNGQQLDRVYLVYIGLVSIARIYMEEGQTKKALEISLALMHYPLEYRRVQDENVSLLKDLQAKLPQEQFEAVMKQVDGKISADQSGATALAFALEWVAE